MYVQQHCTTVFGVELAEGGHVIRSKKDISWNITNMHKTLTNVLTLQFTPLHKVFYTQCQGFLHFCVFLTLIIITCYKCANFDVNPDILVFLVIQRCVE